VRGHASGRSSATPFAAFAGANLTLLLIGLLITLVVALIVWLIGLIWPRPRRRWSNPVGVSRRSACKSWFFATRLGLAARRSSSSRVLFLGLTGIPAVVVVRVDLRVKNPDSLRFLGQMVDAVEAVGFRNCQSPRVQFISSIRRKTRFRG
jgi:hypothetical protein